MLVGIVIIFFLLLFSILLIERIFRKKHKTQSDMTEMILNSNKLANIKFNYFNEYVNAQLDVLEKDERLKSLPGSTEVIENVRKHIADYKDFIDQGKN